MAKLFGTDGIRGKVGLYPLTEEMIYFIGRAAGEYVKTANPHKRKSQRISISKDTRTSGDLFEANLIKGITSVGVDVAKVGVLPTPCSAFLARKLNYDLAIVISASHNDVSDNGLKFFTHKGYKLSGTEEARIEQLILDEENGQMPASFDGIDNAPMAVGTVKDQPEAISLYIDFLKEVVSGCDLSKYKVAVDCAFGSISYLIPEVAKQLNINITAINNTPNGNNINSESGSLFPGVISDYVKRQGSDCGFTFDGDGDRVIACDEKGNILDGDFILAIVGKYLHDKGLLNKNSIVTTLMSNIGLEMAISQWGGRLVKTEVGDKYVLDKMLKSKFNFGGEQSGHIIMLDYVSTGDALVTALFLLKIMAEEARPMAELGRCMYKFPQLLLNIDVDQKRPFEEVPKLKKAIDKCEKRLGSKGRLYIRYSGTENKLRIMVEGQDQLQIRELAEEIANVAREGLSAKAGC